MLYEFHDYYRALLKPMVHLSDACSTLFGDPCHPLSSMPFARDTAARCELFYRLGKTYDKPAFDIRATGADGRRVRVPEETVHGKPFCRLLRFAQRGAASNATGRPARPRVLLVAPFAGHHATLLRDTVGQLLEDHDVYLTDWMDARQVPLSAGSFSLSDYVGYVEEFIRLLGPDLHIVSICQSTVPVLAAVSLLASEGDAALPRSMTMLGGPIDTRASPTRVNRLATEKPLSWFKEMMIHRVPHGHPGTGRRVYPGFLQQACFVSMHAQLHVDSHLDFYRRRRKGEPAERHCAFYDEYNATLDLPEEFYIETVEAVFQECLLARGMWKVGGRAVRPQDIRSSALFTIEGERDDITGLGQTAAAHALCSGIPASKKQSLVAPDCGHYSLFAGHHWRQTVYPRIRDFIRAHAGEEGSFPARGAGAPRHAGCSSSREDDTVFARGACLAAVG